MKLEDVKRYCSSYDDSAWCFEWTRTPWVAVDHEGNGWTFATNGYSFSAVRGRLLGARPLSPGDSADGAEIAATAERYLATPGLTPISVDALREWLRPIGKAYRLAHANAVHANAVIVGGVPVDAWRLLRAIEPLSGAALASSAWRRGTRPHSNPPSMVVIRQAHAVVVMAGLDIENFAGRKPLRQWKVVAP